MQPSDYMVSVIFYDSLGAVYKGRPANGKGGRGWF